MKPSFQSVVDKQLIAEHRLSNDRTTRSAPELAHYRRVLEPVPVSDVGIPRLPLVRPIGSEEQFLLLGEVAQTAGKVVLLAVADNRIELSFTADRLELVPAHGE